MDSYTANHPGQVLHCVIIDAMKMFYRDNGFEPTEITLTEEAADLIQTYCDIANIRANIREEGQYLGMKFSIGSDFTLD